MPVHDWKRVNAGTIHDFHCTWIPLIKAALNKGLLPGEYYAMVEQVGELINPDVLTLHAQPGNGRVVDDGLPSVGGTAVAVSPPRVRSTSTLPPYTLKQRSVVIRHSSGDRVIALIEILSPGNKSGSYPFSNLVEKIIAALEQGIHVLIVDLHPPTARDPQGIHAAILSQLGDETYVQPADKRLTLVSYATGTTRTAYIEPIAVGDKLIPMPLFLTPECYVSTPLEETYMEAFASVPRKSKKVLEAP